MCDCRNRIEAMLTEHHAQQTPSARDHKAVLMGYGIKITRDLGMAESVFMPAELRSTVTVKKTGAEKRKVDKINMHFSHCPFCGEKYPSNGTSSPAAQQSSATNG